MKRYRVINSCKTYFVRAHDSVEAVLKIQNNTKLLDDRLSPMTYKKLKEFGYTSKQWKNWTQEQANKIISRFKIECSSNSHRHDINKSSYKQLNSLSDINEFRRNQDDEVKIALQEYINNGAVINRHYREGNLTDNERDIIKTIREGMKPIEYNIRLYRTSQDETVISDNRGFENNPLLNTTLLEDLVIEENKGKVIEKLTMLVDKGVKCAVPNNSSECEVILDGQRINYEILDVEEIDGIVYKVLHISDKGERSETI